MLYYADFDTMQNEPLMIRLLRVVQKNVVKLEIWQGNVRILLKNI